MSKIKIYLSASTQQDNIGVGNYGTEELQMFRLRDKVEQHLNATGKYIIGKNKNKSSSLSDIVKASNAFGAKLHVAFHTNAGSKQARGCEVYYSYLNSNGEGKKAATILYKHIEELTPSKDRGVKKDNSVYKNGFYELRETNMTAILCEFIFHTNIEDVVFFLNNIDNFAKCTTNAINEYFGIKKAVDKYPIWLRDQGIVHNSYNKDGNFSVNQVDIIFKRFYEKFIKGIK
jgi:N-acetylmuramoyl-L-alanine amidase